MNKKLKVFLLVALILIIILALAVVLVNEISKRDVVIYINNEKILLNLNSENNTINLSTFNSENDIIVKRSSGIEKIKVNDKELKNNEELNLGKIEINNENFIKVDVEFINEKNREFIINTLPSTFPEYSVQGESEYDGDYYITTYSFDYDGEHYIFKLDKSGNMKYYKRTNMISFDFRKEKNENGDIRYMYLEATDNTFEGASSILPCNLVVLDENYKEIDRIEYTNQDGSSMSLENHTYVYLGDNHYILTGYKNIEEKADYEKLGLNQDTVYISDCMIQEIKDGEILWEFKSSDYPELLTYSTKEQLNYSKPYQDYIHINSMAIDEDDGNLLCSFRNIDMILKIDRNNGKIIWKLGGIGDEFNLTDNQKFSKQHSIISIGNNTILLYDNGNSKQRSRVLKMKLNEIDKTIEEFKEYDLDVYAYMMGSVRVLNAEDETYLICYGGGNYNKYSIEEISYSTNEINFRFTFLKDRKLYNVNKMR